MLVYSVYDNMKDQNSTVLDALTALEAIVCSKKIIEARIQDIGIPTPSKESLLNDLEAELHYIDMKMFEHLILDFKDTTPNGYVSVVARDV